jgi:hypothetical protein
VAVNHLTSLALRGNVQVSTDNAHYQGMYPQRVPTTGRRLRRGAAGVVHAAGSFYFAYLRATFAPVRVSGPRRGGSRELFRNHSLSARQVNRVVIVCQMNEYRRDKTSQNAFLHEQIGDP